MTGRQTVVVGRETIERLVEICRAHSLSSEAEVVIPEPYIPLIPEPWNGVIVLAEAQNLSKGQSNYVDELRESSSEERIRRLKKVGDVGIQPWDDGSLKLAVEAALGEKAERTAVSNAVLWSKTDTAGNNANPTDDLVAAAREVWGAMFPVLGPRHVVTAGKVASRVIDGLGDGEWRHTALRLPSPSAMSRVSTMFHEADLLRRYPEVAKVVDARPEWLDGAYRCNKVFFACHAVSVIAGHV